VGYYVDGKRRYLTRIRPNERLASLALEGLRARVNADHELADTAQTLDRFLADWLVRVETRVRSSTLVSYRGHVVKHISPLLGGIPVEDLRASDVDRLVRDRRKAGLSGSTVLRILTTLSMALEQAVREGTLPRNVAYHHWLKLLDKAGLARLRLHDLRHGHATLLQAAGLPIRLIADQLGHASPSTTQNVYAHGIEEQLRAAVEGLGRLSTKRMTNPGA
jgi:site-specific recombinase XerD